MQDELQKLVNEWPLEVAARKNKEERKVILNGAPFVRRNITIAEINDSHLLYWSQNGTCWDKMLLYRKSYNAIADKT